MESARFQFTRSARKYKIGRQAAREALLDAGEPRHDEEGKLVWVGTDKRGRELHIVGVPLPDEDLVLIIHVMPTAFFMGHEEGEHDGRST